MQPRFANKMFDGVTGWVPELAVVALLHIRVAVLRPNEIAVVPTSNCRFRAERLGQAITSLTTSPLTSVRR